MSTAGLEGLAGAAMTPGPIAPAPPTPGAGTRGGAQAQRAAWLALGVVAIMGILASALAWSWVGKPFPGVLLNSAWRVAGIALPKDWSGAEAGLRPGMRVVALDGKPVPARPGVLVWATRTEPHNLAHRLETIGPAGRAVHVVANREFTLKDLGAGIAPLLLAAWTGLVIAGYILMRREPEALARRVAWTGLALGGWAFALVVDSLDLAVPGLVPVLTLGMTGALLALVSAWSTTGHVPGQSLPFAPEHGPDDVPGGRGAPAVGGFDSLRVAGRASGVMGGTTPNAQRGPRLELVAATLLLAPTGMAAAFAEFAATAGMAWAELAVDYGRLMADVILAGALVAFLGLAVVRATAHPSPAERRVAGWIAAVLGLGSALLAVHSALLAGSKLPILPVGWVAIGFIPALLTVAYVSLDGETVALERLGSRAARGLILAAAALMAFSAGTALLRLVFPGGVPALASLALSAACVGAAVPAYTSLKRTIDPLFMRTGYDPAQVVADFSRAAREAFDPDLIVDLFYKDLRKALAPTAGVVYLESGGQLTPVVSEGCALAPPAIDGAGPDLSWVASGHPVDPARIPGAAEGLALPFEPRLATLLSSDEPDEGPLGLVVLGPREDDRPYGAADRDLVVELARIMARGVQTTRLLSRRAAEDRQRRELEVAWEVQANLLPRELPALEGADLEAYARSAREVGGDFYDVMPVDSNRWGILIGEAVGRGISSALLAEVTLSFFRSTAAGTPSPAETLRIVNNLICLYRPSLKASVTVAYAIYDRRDRSLAISNAGQAHPLLNGYPVAIDGVPLGVGRDAAFAESSLTLKKGDAVLWYTDGVPAAVNDEGRAFGQERLLEYTRDERLREAEDPWMLRELLRSHVGDAEQADDMTYLLLLVR